jgi:hypothetical protein
MNDPAPGRTAAVADVIAVTGDTRRLTHVSAGLLAAVLVGSATVAAALAVRRQPLEIGSVALLVPVILCWLGAAVLVLLSERPMSRALAGLRLATGAPVDPSAPWSPLGVRPLDDSEVTWAYVVPLIAAAARQHARSRLALSAAVVTTAVFLLWMLLSLAAVTLA